MGQQIILYGKDNLPSNYTLTSVSWTIPGTGSTPPTAISNFSVASDSTSGGPVSLSSSQLSQQTVTYYFVTPATSQIVKFTLNYNDSSGTAQSATAQATFNISGPTSVNVIACGGNVTSNCVNGTVGQVDIGPVPNLILGGLPNNIGIQFTASATPPTGYSNSFQWIQPISNDTLLIKLEMI